MNKQNPYSAPDDSATSSDQEGYVSECAVTVAQPSTQSPIAFFNAPPRHSLTGRLNNQSALHQRADRIMKGDIHPSETWKDFILGCCGLWECVANSWCPDIQAQNKEQQQPLLISSPPPKK